ncbi:hypothetical protein [Methylibium sp. T29-B]|uniref:hypothetical protein n=1 Tax=Methylibium sp. T29-B TaxID=1437443 RepID=UPI0018CC5762|nr:hypothetical protein [Methylibium sp. T29-B]
MRRSPTSLAYRSTRSEILGQQRVLRQPSKRTGTPVSVRVAIDVIDRRRVVQQLVSVGVAQPHEIGKAGTQHCHRILQRDQNVRIEQEAQTNRQTDLLLARLLLAPDPNAAYWRVRRHALSNETLPNMGGTIVVQLRTSRDR